MTLLNYIFITSFSVLLFILMNSFGEKALLRKEYSNFNEILLSSNDKSYNILLRILTPPLFIGLLSICLYVAGLDFLVINIWLIAAGYWLLFVLAILTFRKYILNLWLLALIAVSSIIFSYIFYIYSYSQGLAAILPSKGDVQFQLWLIVAIFLYSLMNLISPDQSRNYAKRQSMILLRYYGFKGRYGTTIEKSFPDLKFQNIFYSIMIMEDFYRPYIIRGIERLLFFLER